MGEESLIDNAIIIDRKKLLLFMKLNVLFYFMSYYPTIRQIQYLLALYEFKNFRKAAESCFVTQPTLSAAMQELEQGLDVPVLDRSQRKKVVFTAFGLQVIEKSKEIMPLMDDLLSMAQNQAEPFSGVMRLGLSGSATIVRDDIRQHDPCENTT